MNLKLFPVFLFKKYHFVMNKNIICFGEMQDFFYFFIPLLILHIMVKLNYLFNFYYR
jgi:hypothetical protein